MVIAILHSKLIAVTKNKITGLNIQNRADLPEKISSVLIKKMPKAMFNSTPWLAVPSLEKPDNPISLDHITSDGQIDALAFMGDLLNKKQLYSTLRTMDVFNGCRHQCNTCLADAAHPSRMFSTESLERLFSDKRFLRMLQPDSLRFGSSGDLLDHPDGLDILKMALDKTDDLHQKRQAEGKSHKIKVYTNFRLAYQEKQTALLEMAKEYPDRLRVVFSLPFNKNDVVNKSFSRYVFDHPQYFGVNNVLGADGLMQDVNVLLPNLSIADVRHSDHLYRVGRVLSQEHLNGKISPDMVKNGNRKMDFSYLGFVKTYLNPDALWLMVYTTGYESYTNRAFTPITTDNVKYFSKLPFHPDFPKPKHWKGNVAIDYSGVHSVKWQADHTKTFKPLKVIN